MEAISYRKSQQPETLTIESAAEGEKIEQDRKQIRENAYQTIVMLYQQRNVIEKQWKKVHKKDEDYDNKFQQYVNKKQEIEKLSDTVRELFETVSKIDDKTMEKTQSLRNKIGIMRFRPMLPQKQVEQQQKWIWPVKSKVITSGYGYRIHPVFKKKIFHYGIDIGEENNKPIWSVASGRIVKAQWNGGYGNYIEIDHGNGLHSFYGHLNSFNVKVGDYVSQGQIIAKSGNTGIGTGAHLHFGVHKNSQKVNPIDFLPKSQ